MKNLKDYIVDYQNGKTEALNHLIAYRKVAEKNSHGQTDWITRIYYKDKKLNDIYFNIQKKFYWLDDKDLEEWFLYGVYEIIFPKADTTKEPKQIIDWAAKRLNGYIKNKINKERKDDKHTIPEHKDAFDVGETGKGDETEGIYSIYEIASYQDFRKVESASEYKQFLNYFGGIENILSTSQLKLYNLLQGDKKQVEVAEEYGCSGANVSKQTEKIYKEIKTKWLYYKSIKALTELGLFEKIHKFVHDYEMIKRYDATNSYDYFGWLVDFLKDNYKKGEQDNEFKKLHGNKLTLSVSVFDILADEVTKNTYNNLYDLLENGLDKTEFDVYHFGKREKNIIINQVIKSFKKYLVHSEKVVEQVSKSVANGELEERNVMKIS